MTAMTHAGYLATGWTVSLVAIGLYALRVIRRGRRLSAELPPEARRWS